VDRNKTRILLVDDDQGDHVFMRALLNRIDGERYQLDWVPSFGEAFEKDEHDLYFLDYYLEDRDGLELLREAKQRGVQAPLIILTGRGSRTLDVEAMRAGAADYLVKGEIEPDVLERTIRYVLQGGRSIQELQERTERLQAIVEGVPLALYRVTVDGQEAEANPSLRALLGAPDSATLAEKYAAGLFVAPSDREAFIRRLEEDAVVREFKTELVKIDGTRVRVRHSARLRVPEGDGPAIIEGAVLEDTETDGGSGDDSNSARFRTLLRTLDRSAFLLELSGEIADVNPAAAEFLGSAPEELQGRMFLDLLKEEDRVGADAVFSSLASGDLDHRRSPRQLVRHDGESLGVELVCQLVRARGTGRPDSILVLLGGATPAG